MGLNRNNNTIYCTKRDLHILNNAITGYIDALRTTFNACMAISVCFHIHNTLSIQDGILYQKNTGGFQEFHVLCPRTALG